MRGCLVVKFDSSNSLLPSVHTLPVNILRCVRVYITRKYYYFLLPIRSSFLPPFILLFIVIFLLCRPFLLLLLLHILCFVSPFLPCSLSIHLFLFLLFFSVLLLLPSSSSS